MNTERRLQKLKRVCLGKIITLIYQNRTRSIDMIKSVCGGVFAIIGLEINNYNKEWLFSTI